MEFRLLSKQHIRRRAPKVVPEAYPSVGIGAIHRPKAEVTVAAICLTNTRGDLLHCSLAHLISKQGGCRKSGARLLRRSGAAERAIPPSLASIGRLQLLLFELDAHDALSYR